MGFWQQVLSIAERYAEITHCVDSPSFLDLANDVLNQCMTNSAYTKDMQEYILPFRRHSKDYLSLGLKLLNEPHLNQEGQFKLVIGTLLAAKYHNDHYYSRDGYYHTHSPHLTADAHENIRLLLKPHKRKTAYPHFWDCKELDAYLGNKISVLADAVFNKTLPLDESILVKSPLISRTAAFNEALKALCGIYDLDLLTTADRTLKVCG